MKYLVSTAILLSLAAFSAQTHGAMNQGGEVARIVGNTGQPAAAAPAGNPMLRQLGEAGGAGEAAVELCRLDDDVATAKQQQQQQFIQMGGTREQFEDAYRAGYDRAMAEHGNTSPAERERMCNELKRFGSEAGAGW